MLTIQDIILEWWFVEDNKRIAISAAIRNQSVEAYRHSIYTQWWQLLRRWRGIVYTVGK